MQVRQSLALVLILVALLTSTPVFAESLSTLAFNGAAFLNVSLSERTRARGNGFKYNSYIGDGADTYGQCYSGQICDGSAMTGANFLDIPRTDLTITHSSGCLFHVCGKKGYNGGVQGSLSITYNFSFVTPTNDQNIDITVPMALTGVVSGVGKNGILWTANLTGSGEARLCGTVSNGILNFFVVIFHYTGQATPSAAVAQVRHAQ